MGKMTFWERVKLFIKKVLSWVVLLALPLLAIAAIAVIAIIIGAGLALLWGMMANAYDFVIGFVRAGGLFR